MKTEEWIANNLSTSLVQFTGLVLAIHTSRQHTINGTIQKKKDSHSDFQGLFFVFECFECVVIISSHLLKRRFTHHKDRPLL